MVKRHNISTKQERKLNPWFVTGYTDGEGSFSIRLRTKSSSIFGYNVSIVYSIGAEVNPLNFNLLERVKYYFEGVGSISKSGNMYYFEVSSIKALLNVRKHFEEFPLQTTKFVHFKLWCQVMDIINKKEHLTESGFYKILSIKSVFPKGLSPKLLELHPKEKYVSLIKPEFESSFFKTCFYKTSFTKTSKEVLDKYWITGGFARTGGWNLWVKLF